MKQPSQYSWLHWLVKPCTFCIIMRKRRDENEDTMASVMVVIIHREASGLDNCSIRSG